MSIKLAIPAGDLYDKKKGSLMKATLSYSNQGNGSITHINGVHEVSKELKESLLHSKHMAGSFTGKTFQHDTILQFEEPHKTIIGNSWELILTVGMISLLTGIPLKQGVTGSGAIDKDGKITPVGSLARKIKAAREAGLKTFLVSELQEAGEVIDISGIDVIPVANIKQAWCIASGLAPWQVVTI